MENKLKLSILIPTYNRENFIINALESVLNQDFEDYEIICSDNASTDKTYEILQEYSAKYNQIKIYQNDTNLGPVLNWKRCLDNASGEYVHWLWSDDWIESNFYVDAFNLMKKDNTSIVSTWNYRSDNLEDSNEKYLSWQFSFPFIPGYIAAKKILLFTYELPVSPAAYILPLKLVKKHFYINIPKINTIINTVEKGVGVDSLMIIGSCLDVEYISILQKPSVVFRQHDNISSKLAKDGSLLKMYLCSHLWFISKQNIKLTGVEYSFLLKKIIRTLFNEIINYKILSFLIKSLFNISIYYSSQKTIFDYFSKKVSFKRKVKVILSDNLTQFNLKNKKIYLSPFNVITEQMAIEFEKFNPCSICFIDNFKKSKNIIKPEMLEEYDYIFIYSPNFQKEISKDLPKKNLYLLTSLKNDVYDAKSYSKFLNLKIEFKNLLNLKIIRERIKEKNLFDIGSDVIYLSEDMKRNDFLDKTIYLVPYNNVTKIVFAELKKLNITNIKYIDDRYKNNDIIDYKEIEEYDYIFINESNIKNKSLKQLSKKNKFLLFHIPKKGMSIMPYTHFNKYNQNIKNFLFKLYLNSIYKSRIFLTSFLKLPIHLNEKKILNLKNKYKGKRAFIIGNGPSLKISDLDMLKNEITFASNKIYLAYEETTWRPTFYSVEDNLVMHEIYNKIVELKDSTIILPMKDLKEYNVIKNAIYYPLRRKSGGFSNNLLSGLYPGHTVTFTMIQMAIYIGIEEIYLIGVDFNYEQLTTNTLNSEVICQGKELKPKVICQSKEFNHFHKDYRKEGDHWVEPNIEGQIRAYQRALKFCEDNKIKIYNASRSTKLEVFPLINFDTLLSN